MDQVTMTILMLVVCFGLMYFLTIRPQKKKEEELKQEQRQKKDKILPSHIAQVVAKWTHIPVEQMEDCLLYTSPSPRDS